MFGLMYEYKTMSVKCQVYKGILLCPPHWGVDILFLLFPPSHLVSRHFRQQFLSYVYQIWHAGLLG